MRVYISGLHSGPNPSPGVGVVRSLRHAFPQAKLIGVDYSIRSSGIHYEGFDELWIQRPWNELDLDLHREQIQQVLEGEAVWISGLDLEVQWLANTLPNEPKILVPPSAALKRVVKPAIPAAGQLPIKISAHILANQSTWELYAFCRQHGWPLWCKGPNYEARQVENWKEVLEALADMQEVWATHLPALQAHVQGYEESIVFCSYQGELLGCVCMEKRLQTPEGKTWAGCIYDVSPSWREAIQKVVKELEWTGGAELEFVRDEQDDLYLIDWNPRFPAWIYGATLAGYNLPALLVQGAGFKPTQKTTCISREFSRIVIEVPVRKEYPLPAPSPPSIIDRKKQLGKHPSGMPLLAKRLAEKQSKGDIRLPKIPEVVLQDLSATNLEMLMTPQRLFLRKTAQQTFAQARTCLDREGLVRIAYSVKTNPHRALMELAKQNGLLAEAITTLELQHALNCGFSTDQIILNGPAQGWLASIPIPGPLYAVFADSLERLEILWKQGIQAQIIGVRLRPLTVSSRFGINLEEFEEIYDLINLLQRFDNQALGVHFHVQSDVSGVKSWWEIYEAMLYWARTLQEGSGQPIRCLDVGGGWFPNDFVEEFVPKLPGAIRRAKELLPKLQSFVIEPGKALAQPCIALATRVLEIRHPRKDMRGNNDKETKEVEIVVDASISDLPMAPHFPHRLLACSPDGSWVPVRDGESRILGRNCMESDILAQRTEIPNWLQVGDMLIILDAGAYDASMAYKLGTGNAARGEDGWS